jgi:DegV family protein with EDD domain
VCARAHEARRALSIWFCIDTLEYLQRGGRVGRAQAWLGGALKIKPVLSLEAEITPVERVRTAGRAFERMVDYLRMRRDDGADGWVIQHIQSPDRAAELVARGRELFGSEPMWVSEVGPVIGTYTGPGLLGVGGVPARLLA